MKALKEDQRWFRRYFLFLGIGLCLAGLLGHAFFYATGYNWNYKTIGWTGSALAVFCLERGTILGFRNKLSNTWIQVLLIGQVIKLLIFFYLISYPNPGSFEFVKANTAIGIGGIVLIGQGILYRMDKIEGRLFIVGGVLFGVLTALVYNNQITLNKWFNYHDISHLMTAISIFIMFTGVRKILQDSLGQEGDRVLKFQ